MAAARGSRRVLLLPAVAALLAATYPVADAAAAAALVPPSRDVPAAAVAVVPAAGVPLPPTTAAAPVPPSRDVPAAGVAVVPAAVPLLPTVVAAFHGARRLGRPHHRLRLYDDVPADAVAPAVTTTSDAAAADAEHRHQELRTLVFGLVVIIAGTFLAYILVAGFARGAALVVAFVKDRYAAAMAARRRATRVRPLDQAAAAAAAAAAGPGP